MFAPFCRSEVLSFLASAHLRDIHDYISWNHTLWSWGASQRRDQTPWGQEQWELQMQMRGVQFCGMPAGKGCDQVCASKGSLWPQPGRCWAVDGEELFDSRAIHTVKSVWIEDWLDEVDSVQGGFFLHVCAGRAVQMPGLHTAQSSLPDSLPPWPAETLPVLCSRSSSLPRQCLLPGGHLSNLSTWRWCYFLNLSRRNVLLPFAQRQQIASPVFTFTNVSTKLL